MNKAMIIGRLTRDPELKYTQNGAPVCSFAIAHNYVYTKDGEKIDVVSFFNCVAWNKTGEIINTYFKKGQRIGVTGRLLQRRWQDQDGNSRQAVDIVVDEFDFIESAGQSNGNKPEGEPEKTNGKPSALKDGTPVDKADVPPQANNPFSDEDIPF